MTAVSLTSHDVCDGQWLMQRPILPTAMETLITVPSTGGKNYGKTITLNTPRQSDGNCHRSHE